MKKLLKLSLVSFLLMSCNSPKINNSKIAILTKKTKVTTFYEDKNLDGTIFYVTYSKQIDINIDNRIVLKLKEKELENIFRNINEKLLTKTIVTGVTFIKMNDIIYLILLINNQQKFNGIKSKVANFSEKNLKEKMIVTFLKLFKKYYGE